MDSDLENIVIVLSMIHFDDRDQGMAEANAVILPIGYVSSKSFFLAENRGWLVILAPQIRFRNEHSH
jgi:hypothetical protein